MFLSDVISLVIALYAIKVNLPFNPYHFLQPHFNAAHRQLNPRHSVLLRVAQSRDPRRAR